MRKHLLREKAIPGSLSRKLLFCFTWMLLGAGLLQAQQVNPVQDPVVNASGTNVTIKSLLNEIEKQTGYVFFYNNQSVNVEKRVTVAITNQTLASALTQLFGRNTVSYRIMGKQIALYPRNSAAPSDEEMLAASPGTAADRPSETAATQQPGNQSRSVTVTGTVVDDEDGEPLGYSTVAVKGTSVGAIIDSKGQFSITIPAPAVGRTLVFSQLSYVTQEVTYDGSRNVLNIKLSKEAVLLDDVVVTGFQNIKKETFTGSSVKIMASDMELAGFTDVSRMLEGKVAGVSIQNVSSTFGAAPKVRVRGATSIRGENKPLWVVDGVVLEDIVNISNDQLSSGDPTTLLGSSVAGINSSDIESFDILKDAAATALYGARAMNGVIVITTKRGKQGAPVINYSGNFTIRTKPRYENFDIMNSADQMGVYAELYGKGGLLPGITNESKYGPYGMMYYYLSHPDPSTGQMLENTPEARSAFLYKYAKANTDWFDVLFTNNLMQEHSVSISSGSEKSRVYASLGFLHDAGATIADQVNRYTANIRNDLTIGKYVNLGLLVNGSLRTQKTPGSFSREIDEVRGEYNRDFDINPFNYAYNTSRAVRPYNDRGDLEYVTMNYAPFNILNELRNNTLDLNVIDLKAQVELGVKLAKGLSFNFMGAMRYVNSQQDHRIRPNSNVAEAYRSAGSSTIAQKNPFLWRDIENTNNVKEGIVVLPQGGFYNTLVNEMMHYNVRNSLSYNKVWQGAVTHEFNLLGGMEVKFTDRKVNKNSLVGYMFDGSDPLPDPNYYKMMSQRQIAPGNVTDTYDRFAAFYGTAHYTFDRRYSVDATFRYDGSNALGASISARWLPTWNFGAKWIISNESFMDKLTAVDNMSIRLSYGLNATMPPTVNSRAVFYASTTFAPGFAQNMINLDKLANVDLTWEKSYLFNAGFDVSLFDNRLNLYVDYFNRKSFDLIDLIKTSGIGGEMYKYANYADLDSHGVDITLGGQPVRTKDWGLSMNFTFGFSENKIKNAKNLPMIYELVGKTGGNLDGYAVNSLFSIPFAGLDPENGVPLFYQPDSPDPDKGANMQSSNTVYLKHEGQVDPKYTGGLNTTLRWKSLSMNIFLSYQWGNVVRLDPIFRRKVTDLDASSRILKDRWMNTGDEQWTNIPSLPDVITGETEDLDNVFPYVNYNYSDVRVAKGDFIRLKSLSLNYELPAAWLAKTKAFRTASIRVTGKDLWLIYSDKKLNGQDPEFFNTGGVAMPVMPQCVFTLSLGF